MVISLLAAARVLCGDPTSAQTVFDRLPAQTYKLDHGAGYCLVAPFHALCAALPLPAELKDTTRWLAGSATQAALRAWLADHCDKLVWDERSAVYRIGGA